MPPAPGPEEAYGSFQQEVELLLSAARTASPTQDKLSPRFYGLPYDDFIEELRLLRDEIEQRAYLAIVAATEAVLQVDFRTRVKARAVVVLRDHAKKLEQRERKGGRRIEVEHILDGWSTVAGIRQAAISEFKQLLGHRHWLAHGRHFVNRAGVRDDPAFAFDRSRVLLAELSRTDTTFPRQA